MNRIPSSEMTDKKTYLRRREFITAMAAAAGGVLAQRRVDAQQPAVHGRKLATVRSPLSTTETPNTWEHVRSEEHTSELQSQSNLVCRLLLEKKKKQAGRRTTR